MSKKPKKTPRTIEQINEEYANHAAQHGHKSRVLHGLGIQREQLEKDIQGHLAQLVALNQEGFKLQSTAPTLVAAAKTPDPTPETTAPAEVAMTEGASA